MSHKIVQAIRLICLSVSFDLSHVRDDNDARTTDETWMPKFAREGGMAILTGDANILKKPHLLLAIKDTGLTTFVLHKDWTHARKHEQAANILYWWPRIEEAAKTSNPGDCWPIPFAFDKTPLAKKTIQYDKAARALGKI